MAESLNLVVKPETAATFHKTATARGVSVDTLAEELEADAAQDLEDAAEAQRRLTDSDKTQRRTLADLRAHIEAHRESQKAA